LKLATASLQSLDPLLAFVSTGTSKRTILFLLFVSGKIDKMFVLLGSSFFDLYSSEGDHFGLGALLLSIMQLLFFALELEIT
jgi:hypothetical protein